MIELLRPRVRVLGDLWLVGFGNGAAAVIELDPDDRSAWPSSAHRWRVGGPGLEASGVSYSREVAMRSVWCLAARLSPPPPVDVDADAFARAVDREDEPVRAAAVIRKLLEQRTGRRWSVRIGRGSRRAQITIGGPLGAGEAALLAAVLCVDYVGPLGYTIGSRMGARYRAVLAIAGGVETVEPAETRPAALVH